jgi:hypothetical protein
VWTEEEGDRFLAQAKQAARRRREWYRTRFDSISSNDASVVGTTSATPINLFALRHVAAVSPWFYKPRHCRRIPTDHVARHEEELSEEDCHEQMKAMLLSACVDGGNVSVTCPVCTLPLQKSSACNALSHCGVEICNVCGRFTTGDPGTTSSRNYTTLQSTGHWDPKGKCGCPRWDSDDYWDIQCRAQFVCTYGYCHDETRACTLAQHAMGRSNMNAVRLFNMLYHRFRWLREHKREGAADRIMHMLQRDLHALLPEPSSQVHDTMSGAVETVDYVLAQAGRTALHDVVL